MSTLYNNIIGKVLFLFLFNTSFNVFAITTVTHDSDTISFVVYFDEKKEQRSINEGDYLQALIDIYELEIVSFFDVDNDFRAFVVVAKKDIYMPLDLARELSFVEGVLMVELGKLVRVKEEI